MILVLYTFLHFIKKKIHCTVSKIFLYYIKIQQKHLCIVIDDVFDVFATSVMIVRWDETMCGHFHSSVPSNMLQS